MQRIGATGLITSLMMAGAMPCWADEGIGPFVNSVPAANAAVGSPADILSSDFSQVAVVTGTDALENPSGLITTYGFLSDGTITHPDENTYLVLPSNPRGPKSGYNYGRHFLFQGHENAGNLAYITRVNLDVTDPAHRITLLTPVGSDGLTHFSRIDGSTYDPFTETLLFTQEGGPTDGGVIEVSRGWPATVTTLYGILGRGGFEGIHPDNNGRLYLAEDVGGANASVDPNDINGATKRARQPNSFIYRFLPYDRRNLEAGGKLQVLQATVNGTPLVFGGTSATAVFNDVWAQAQLDLHSGAAYPTKWITIHDTAVDGTADFDANGLARAGGGTPFKRPENGGFKPDGKFRTFVFTTTGDTDNRSGSVAGLAARGAWGGIFELNLDSNQDKGTIHLFALGDADHNSFDNIAFGDSKTILVAEDRGDTLHDQLNTLDSLWAYPTDGGPALRVIAQGRDVSATPVAGEDNEVTGVFVSNGGVSAGIGRMHGRKEELRDARGFYTKQHGDDVTYELIHNGDNND